MPTSRYSRCFRLLSPPGLETQALAFLAAEGFASEPEPFSPICRRLTAEPFPLGASLAAIFGYIYIQDRSSMLPPLLLHPPTGASVVDMAASPGSKSGFLGQLTGPTGLVLANDPSRDRLATLRANLLRTSLCQVITSAYPGEELPLPPASQAFILLDPPCSGWGTAEKHPKTLRLWTGARITPLIALQRALLRRAADLLAPGGLLMYSTCTTNPAENEEQTAFACAELGLQPHSLPPVPGFCLERKGPGALLVNGAASDAQGFYLSLLKRPGEASPESGAISAPPDFLAENLMPRANLECDIFNPDLLPPGEVALFGDKARFLPLQALHLPLRWQGMLLGRFAHGNFTPAPQLRCALPSDGPKVIFEEVAQIRQFLSGAALKTGVKGSRASLWWRQLPLGTCQIKNGRPIAGHRG